MSQPANWTIEEIRAARAMYSHVFGEGTGDQLSVQILEEQMLPLARAAVDAATAELKGQYLKIGSQSIVTILNHARKVNSLTRSLLKLDLDLKPM